jgi:hypothetical protein
MYKITTTGDSSRTAYGIVYIASDSACSFQLTNDQYAFNEYATDSLIVLPVFQNDSLCQPLSQHQTNLKSLPVYGQVSSSTNGFNYKVPASVSFPFADHFTYEVCIDAVCKTARVDVKLKKDSLAVCTIYARPDSIDISALSANVANLQVLLNDSICGNLNSFKITKAPLYGTSVVSNQVITYERTNHLSKFDSLRYEICNDIGCSEAAVIIKRND